MKTLQLLNKAAAQLHCRNIISNRLDSEILLSKVLKIKRENLLTKLDLEIDLEKIVEFNKLILRRSLNEPVAYILKEKEFWSKSFEVSSDTLIPRPETELLVEKLVKIYQKKNINILDVGTGCGCIIISLLSELKKSRGTGIDISKKAINVAKKNARKFDVMNKIQFINISLVNFFSKKFDLIVSNPPYIKNIDIKNLDNCIKHYEPKIALDGGNDGLDVIKKVIYKANEILKYNGLLALEIGNGQFKKVSTLLLKNLYRVEDIVKDHKNNIRCIIARKLF